MDCKESHVCETSNQHLVVIQPSLDSTAYPQTCTHAPRAGLPVSQTALVGIVAARWGGVVGTCTLRCGGTCARVGTHADGQSVGAIARTRHSTDIQSGRPTHGLRQVRKVRTSRVDIDSAQRALVIDGLAITAPLREVVRRTRATRRFGGTYVPLHSASLLVQEVTTSRPRDIVRWRTIGAQFSTSHKPWQT